MRELRLLILALGSAAVTGACYAYRQTALAPVSGAQVRLVLTSPAGVIAMTPGRDETRHIVPGVFEASGRLEAGAGDTLVLRLGVLRTAAGVAPKVEGQVALIATAQIARIEERRFQAGTTLLAGAGFAMLAFGTFMVLVLTTIFRNF